jgi:hypothetical protein
MGRNEEGAKRRILETAAAILPRGENLCTFRANLRADLRTDFPAGLPGVPGSAEKRAFSEVSGHFGMTLGGMGRGCVNLTPRSERPRAVGPRGRSADMILTKSVLGGAGPTGAETR